MNRQADDHNTGDNNSVDKDPDNVDPIAEWMQSLAAPRVEAPCPIDPQVLWWKAQALRRLDKERERTIALEQGERIQIASSVAAVVGLLGWLWLSVARSWLAPAIVSMMVVAGLCIGGAAALRAWRSRSSLS